MMQTTIAVVRKVQNIKHTFWNHSQLTCGSSSALVVCQQGWEQAGCTLLSALEIAQGKLHKMGLLHLTAPEVLLRWIKIWYHTYFWKSNQTTSCLPWMPIRTRVSSLAGDQTEWKPTCFHSFHPWLFPWQGGQVANDQHQETEPRVFERHRQCVLAVDSKEEKHSLHCQLQKVQLAAKGCCMSHRDQSLINWTSSPEEYV